MFVWLTLTVCKILAALVVFRAVFHWFFAWWRFVPLQFPEFLRQLKEQQPGEGRKQHDRRICVVIGCNGFVGRHLAALLERLRMYDTIRLVDVSPSIHRVCKPGIEHWLVDINDFDELCAAMENASVVFHLANVVDTRSSMFHKTRLRVNVVGTLNVLRACVHCGVKRLVFTSSAAAVITKRLLRNTSSTRTEPFEPSLTQGGGETISLYGHTKQMAERLVMAANGLHGLKTVALRPHYVFGLGDPLYTQEMALGKMAPPCLGKNVLTTVHVNNVAQWHVLADEWLHNTMNEETGRCFDIGNGEDEFVTGTQLGEFFRTFRSQARGETKAKERHLVPIVARLLACTSELVDFFSCGRRKSSFLLLTRAAVKYSVLSFPFNTREAQRTLRFKPLVSVQGAFNSMAEQLATVGPNKVEWNTIVDHAGLPLPNESSHVVPCAVPSCVAPSAQRGAASVVEPLKLRAITLKNRVMRSATYEAMCPDGVPTDLLTRFHHTVAAGGTAITTVAYAACCQDGRTFDEALLMDERARAGLTDLCSSVHAEGGFVSIQLCHSGYFSDPAVIGTQPISASVTFNPKDVCWSRAMTEADCTRIETAFADAARLAVECGFDAIEVHCGHGYLLSQFLSPFTNRRSDHYGGSAFNRARFPFQVLRAVRRAIGNEKLLFVKFNLEDGFKEGLQLKDAVQFAQWLDSDWETNELGIQADLLIPSAGFTSRNGFYMLRGDVPLVKMALAAPWKLKIPLLVFGRVFIPKIEWEPNFLRNMAAPLMTHMRHIPVALLGGINSIEDAVAARRMGFAMIVQARALLREPGWVNQVHEAVSKRRAHTKVEIEEKGEEWVCLEEEKAEEWTSLCDQCNECVVYSTMAHQPLCCMRLKEMEERT